jgi:hypothetical protein
MLARRSLQSVVRLNGNASTSRRQFAVSSIACEEAGDAGAAASSKKKASVDFTAELRRALGKSKQSDTSASSEANASRRQGQERTGPRRTQPRRSDSDRPRRSQPSVLRKRNDNEAGRARFTFKSAQEAPRKIAEDVRPNTDWSLYPQASVPYARVPYGNPGVDLQSLGAKRDLKAHRPLKSANKSLTLSAVSGLPNFVRGPAHSPTPLARAGRSEGEKSAAKSYVSASATETTEGRLTTTTSSVATEAREERLRIIRESVGGEYTRWSADTILNSVEKPSGVTTDAAYAVARNYDMQPTHKAFTMSAVQQILAGITPTKMTDKVSSKRK